MSILCHRISQQSFGLCFKVSPQPHSSSSTSTILRNQHHRDSQRHYPQQCRKQQLCKSRARAHHTSGESYYIIPIASEVLHQEAALHGVSWTQPLPTKTVTIGRILGETAIDVTTPESSHQRWYEPGKSDEIQFGNPITGMYRWYCLFIRRYIISKVLCCPNAIDTTGSQKSDNHRVADSRGTLQIRV
jgi:hypothetical protein